MTRLPDIDVMVLTYRHESFIDQCLEGIMTQQYEGNVRIVVSDDCSSDNTLQKVKSWQEKFPNIELLQAEQNLGPGRNFAKALNECKAPLLAFCEGDDFWIDPHKLQMQATALITNPEATISYTNYRKVDAAGIAIATEVLGAQPEKFYFRDLLFGQGPSINSSVVRRSCIAANLPEEFFKIPNPDVFIFAMALIAGHGVYSDAVTSAYRLHGGGIWSTLGSTEQKLVRLSTRLVMLAALHPADWKEFRDELYARFSIEMEKAYAADRSIYEKFSKYLTPFGRKAIPLKLRLGF
jgi:glycosyltransferase involved in cell wall biosynthesis